MSKKNKFKDPHASREAEKYNNPIPSREYILDLMQAQEGSSWKFEKLCQQLNIHDDEQLSALEKRIKAMLRDRQLIQNKKGLLSIPEPSELIAGKGH